MINLFVFYVDSISVAAVLWQKLLDIIWLLQTKREFVVVSWKNKFFKLENLSKISGILLASKAPFNYSFS